MKVKKAFNISRLSERHRILRETTEAWMILETQTTTKARNLRRQHYGNQKEYCVASRKLNIRVGHHVSMSLFLITGWMLGDLLPLWETFLISKVVLVIPSV